MPTVPISMKKLQDILRLKYGCAMSHRQIAKSLSISPSTVSHYLNRAAQLGITHWPLEACWTDKALASAFQGTQVQPKRYAEPNWPQLHQELKHKTMTLQLLWTEYADQHPDGHYSYNHFCRLYKAWRQCQQPSMRQVHVAGEKLFVDYCGPTIGVVDPDTGELHRAQVFVAVLGASNYTYAEATWTQGLEDWVMSHARCFTYLGGVPEVVVPDNLKSAVSKACRYEPDLNPTYHQLALHYDTAVVPARPYKPKDKAKAEVAVQVVERWIIAVLRHETFFSLKQLNQRIGELLAHLNRRPFKKLPGSRLSAFEALDKPALKPLPQQPYTYTQVKTVRVHLDYHVELDKHYYSVPHALVKKSLEAHLSGELVTLYHQGERVAVHPRAHRQGGHTTEPNHMPPAHQKHREWTPERFERWAGAIGKHTKALVSQWLAQRTHVEQSYRACLGLLNLAKTYTPARLEAACERALHSGIHRFAGIRNILAKGLDSQPLPSPQRDRLGELEHHNIRGSGYYH